MIKIRILKKVTILAIIICVPKCSLYAAIYLYKNHNFSITP